MKDEVIMKLFFVKRDYKGKNDKWQKKNILTDYQFNSNI